MHRDDFYSRLAAYRPATSVPTRAPQLGGLLEEDELAYQLGISPGAMRRLRRTHAAPPHIKLGMRILYRPEAVREWLIAVEQQSKTAA